MLKTYKQCSYAHLFANGLVVSRLKHQQASLQCAAQNLILVLACAVAYSMVEIDVKEILNPRNRVSL